MNDADRHAMRGTLAPEPFQNETDRKDCQARIDRMASTIHELSSLRTDPTLLAYLLTEVGSETLALPTAVEIATACAVLERAIACLHQDFARRQAKSLLGSP